MATFKHLCLRDLIIITVGLLILAVSDGQLINEEEWFCFNLPSHKHCHYPSRPDPALSFTICKLPVVPPTTTAATTPTTPTPTTTTTAPPNITNVTSATTQAPQTTPTTVTTPTPFPPIPNVTKCPAIELFNSNASLLWNDYLMKQKMNLSQLNLTTGPCSVYFQATLPEHPDPIGVGVDPSLADFSCSSPYSVMPEFDENIVRSMNMTKVRESLPPMKHRYSNKLAYTHRPMECLETWTTDDPEDPLGLTNGTGRYQIPPQCLHCPATTKFDRRYRKKQDKWAEYAGEIVPFSELDEPCTLENEAYLHGAAISFMVEKNDFDLDKLDGSAPWGRLDHFFPRLVNLHLGGIDVDENGADECVESDFKTKLLYGDCIFNQRLAVEPTKHTVTDVRINLCRGTKSFFHEYSMPVYTKLNYSAYGYPPPELKIPVVGLGCAPNKLLFCDQNYNDFQMMQSKCICHPMYAFYSNKTDECLPMAGVPCRFNQSADGFAKLFTSKDCAPNMECISLEVINARKTEDKDRWQRFEKSFAGFGMSPIARDYMVSIATHGCVCKRDASGQDLYIETPFNECLTASTQDSLHNNALYLKGGEFLTVVSTTLCILLFSNIKIY